MTNKKEVPAHFRDIREIVDDPVWQKLRGGFVGTWKTHNAENVKKLRNYLGKMKNPLKVRRVHNYLTGSAFRIGVISSKEINELLEEVRIAWNKIKLTKNK